MLLTALLPILLPLALARPHHPDQIAHRRQAAAARLVERAGAAYDDEIQGEISSYNQAHESSTVAIASSSTVVIASSSAVPTASPSAVEAVGSALTAVNTPSSVASTSAQSSAVISSAAAASPSPVQDVVTSEDAQPSPSADVAVVSSSSSTDDVASSTPTSTARSVQTKVVTASRSSTVVRVTASASPSASAAAANSDEKIAGLPKTTFIAIIVVAAVVALAGIGWTVFRKLRLGPSRRFDEKMRPIDFSPHNDTFMEKSHHRSSSHSSAALQRDEFVAELDSKHVDGVPDHDFTAAGNMAGQGAYDDYHQDPYASAEAYEYDAAYHYDDVAQHHAHQYDQPTQDTGAGYTDLQRGNSIGSGSGHGHGHHQVQYPVEQFPMPDHYLGRPTGGSDGPYAQASHRY